MNRTRTVCSVFCFVATTAPALAGPTTPPPGPVGSTYKTLTEVEPSIAINATNTPGDADSMFRITAPGAYYLTGDLFGVAAKHGIEIATHPPPPALRGFAVLGTLTSLNGITTSGARNAVVVRNGTVSGWGDSGVYLSTGGRGSLVESIIANGNGEWGISLGTAGVVRGCSASQNGTGFANNGGIAAQGGLIESCVADGNNGVGLAIGTGGIIRACSATNNTVYGINGGYVSTVASCSLDGNLRGIEVYRGSSVTDCTVGNSAGFAIQGSDGCAIRNNLCSNTTASAGSRGVRVIGSGSRVEGNTCSGFETGLSTSSTGNFFTRNTARANTTNWSITAGNVCYVVSAPSGTAISGNSGGLSPGSTDPNANFTY